MTGDRLERASITAWLSVVKLMMGLGPVALARRVVFYGVSIQEQLALTVEGNDYGWRDIGRRRAAARWQCRIVAAAQENACP
jgi:hypothetical protein